MSRNAPTRASARTSLGALALLLALAAVLANFPRQPSRVTVSGVSLKDSREKVISRLSKPSFQEGHPVPTHLEYWSNPVNLHPSLSLDFDRDGRLLRVEGGDPEIDGAPVRGWSLGRVEQALGPAGSASRGGEVGGNEAERDEFLRYPDRRLLVRYSRQKGTSFVLFTGDR